MAEEVAKQETPSEFYYACRNNQVDTVRQLLTQSSLEQLDRMEPNGSTALHVACFHKHPEVVSLLLERGFTRRVRNKFENTPYDEAETDELKQLFTRSNVASRFGGDLGSGSEKLTWMIIDGNEQNVLHERPADTYHGNRLEYGTFHADRLLQQLGASMPKLDVVRRLLRRAIEEKDCKRLIQAFTTDTEFSQRINAYLLSPQDTGVQANGMSEFVDTIFFNHKLHEKYQYLGKCYRSVKLNSLSDLDFYKKDTKMVNRTYLSATKDRLLAKKYVSEFPYVALLSFEIRQSSTCLDIESLSEFPHEKEVLIMNNSIFKVMQVITKNNFEMEIELRESKSARFEGPNRKNSLFDKLRLN